MDPRPARGVLALIVGAMPVVVLFMPLVAVSHRRHGAMTPLRMAGWAATLAWVLGLWTYTLLPLPSPVAVGSTVPNLQVVTFIDDIARVATAGVLLRVIFGRGALTARLGGFGI